MVADSKYSFLKYATVQVNSAFLWLRRACIKMLFRPDAEWLVLDSFRVIYPVYYKDLLEAGT